MMPVFVITVGDVVGIVATLVALLVIAAIYIPDWIKQSRCKHDGGVTETRACDAICNKCLKNLGFIGNLRKSK